MANLTNCALCGSRERPSDLSLIGGKYICERCADDVFAMFDDPRWARDYIERSTPVAPKNLWGDPLDTVYPEGQHPADRGWITA